MVALTILVVKPDSSLFPTNSTFLGHSHPGEVRPGAPVHHCHMKPIDHEAELRRGFQALEQLRVDEATLVFRQLLARTPEDPRVQMGLGWALVTGGDFRGAVACFQTGGGP